MNSPFPGMDPYLEGYLWPDVYQALAYQFRRQLAPLVAPRYAVRLAVTMLTDRVPAHELGIMYPPDLACRIGLEILTSRFSEGELRVLCFDLGIGYQDLLGEEKTESSTPHKFLQS